MFGFFIPNRRAMTKEQQKIYRSYYCGLCRAIGKRHGQLPRLALSYEMTFLALLLSSLEKEEAEETKFLCATHPLGAKPCRENRFLDYAADMTVLLALAKAEDDITDDGSAGARVFASALAKEYGRVKAQYPKETEALDGCLSVLKEMEKNNELTPDLPASAFGNFTALLFSEPRKDGECGETLAALGFLLGKFLYLLDAAVDLKKDLKRGSYNPLVAYPPALRLPMLEGLRDEAMRILDTLPVVRNKEILGNILCSGAFTKYYQTYHTEHSVKEQQ